MVVSILRLLFILSILSVLTMVLFILRCGEGMTIDDPESLEYKQHQEIQHLKEKINELEKQLKRVIRTLNDTGLSDILDPSEKDHVDLFQEAKETYQKNNLELQNDMKYIQDEYDVIQYASFAKNWIYVVNAGTYGRVLERLAGVKRQDIQQVVLFATTKLYESKGATIDKFQFMDGIFRTDPGIGTRYELYFKNVSPNSVGHYRKITVFRPFGTLHHIASTNVNSKKDLIHMIIPLSGRLEAFKLFMKRFIILVIKPKEAVFLSVVNFGTENADEIKNIIDGVKKTHNFTSIRFIQQTEVFSRGRAIQTAVDMWSGEDVLMFFCDIDIVYTESFLQRCRMNTQQGVKIFYPIVFSLYNPNVIYALQDIRKPRPEDQIKITTETGFWRDFGYGMTCQYHSDFLRMKGFKQDIVGWGTEDTLLYRKYVQSNITVVRAVDHGLFHLWHEKECDHKMAWKQFKSCISSRARNEASHGLLGMLAFQDEIEAYKKGHGMLIRKANRTGVHV